MRCCPSFFESTGGKIVKTCIIIKKYRNMSRQAGFDIAVPLRLSRLLALLCSISVWAFCMSSDEKRVRLVIGRWFLFQLAVWILLQFVKVSDGFYRSRPISMTSMRSRSCSSGRVILDAIINREGQFLHVFAIRNVLGSFWIFRSGYRSMWSTTLKSRLT